VPLRNRLGGENIALTGHESAPLGSLPSRQEAVVTGRACIGPPVWGVNA
jgi:hypothetical protein